MQKCSIHNKMRGKEKKKHAKNMKNGHRLTSNRDIIHRK